MKLAAISMIRDEADIIAPFLRHLAALFDIVFLFDQRSSDGTSDVMREVCAARENWSYYFCDFAGRHQKEVNTIFMQKAFKHGADAVFFLDSDEFIGVPSKADLQKMAYKMNEGNAIGDFHWRPCVPTTFDEWHFDPSVPLWVANQNSHWKKIAVSRSAFLSAPSIRVTAGNHDVVVSEGKDDLQHMQSGHFFHVPVRSRQQLIQKVFVSAIANFAKNNLMTGESLHKRRLLEVIADQELSDDVLASISGRFSELGEFVLWGRMTELAQHGFLRRTLDIPIADFSLPLFPRPDLNRIIARCLRDFEHEILKDGEGSLQIERETIRFQRAATPETVL